ncbi:hypothetical protein CHIBA101_2226 [Actinomyces sp. Chiba101]|nr:MULTISPECIES: DUF364 domain-containing protein [Actinomyces]BAW94049.1 hypothetical protein CHIBA101_2226 [Actinomyces sp. Chiba101]GAV95396.1 hypothetical protein ADENT20671_2182 [Actinomyces denticolens]
MTNPWEIYDALIDDIPDDARVTAVHRGPQWSRVLNDAGGLGAGYTIDAHSRPALSADSPVEGRSLRDAASLVRSWNLAEASVGLAAINSWYSRQESAVANGFVATGKGVGWREVFDPYNERFAGGRIGIVGHFPFARGALARTAEVIILERDPRPGDYPDTACEYLLADCDAVLISSSSLVNKTMPRLIELAVGGGAHTVLVGPSTPMHPLFLDLGVDTITGWVADSGLEPAMLDVLPGIGPGHRMHLHRVPA